MIRRQITLPAPADRVWEAITDPEQASNWFGGRIEWDLEEGAAFRYTDDDGSGRVGWIDVVRPGRYLRYRWWGGPDGASEVSYLLEPEGEGTRLTVQERSLVTGPGTDRAATAAPQASATVTAPATWTRWDSLLAAVWATLSAPAFCRIVA